MRRGVILGDLRLSNDNRREHHEDRGHRWKRTRRRERRPPTGRAHDPVPASPTTGVDTITGEGLADVMLGANTVVDVSNAPV
jgi:hypothetical protein